MDTAQRVDPNQDAAPPEVRPDGGDVPTLGDIEGVIERIGAQYVAELRTLTDEIGRFYATQSAAKDEQIASLSDRARAVEVKCDALQRELDRYIDQINTKDAQILSLMQQAEAVERERDDIARRYNKVIDASTEYLRSLQQLSERLTPEASAVEVAALARPPRA